MLMPVRQVIVTQQDTAPLLEKLELEMKECTEVQSSYARKVKKFMVANGVWHLKDLDYFWRVKYEKFLMKEVEPVSYTIYLKAFDRLKQHTIHEPIYLVGKGKYKRPLYNNQILFLPYHPNPEVRKRFANASKKQDLLWDFSIPASEILKQQIFQALHNIIENEKDVWRCRAKMLALKYLYEF